MYYYLIIPWDLGPGRLGVPIDSMASGLLLLIAPVMAAILKAATAARVSARGVCRRRRAANILHKFHGLRSRHLEHTKVWGNFIFGLAVHLPPPNTRIIIDLQL
jgi:hypothetical protein